MTVKPLPTSQFTNVLTWAAASINQLEDGDSEQPRERNRLQDVARDKKLLAQSVAMLFDLINRYGFQYEADVQMAALRSIERTIAGRIAGETETWLTPKEGRPRRTDYDHFAHVILALAEDRRTWSIQGAAYATAAVVDSVWSNDPRTKAKPFARKLWGETYSSNSQERIEALAETLRKRAQDLKRRTLSKNSIA